MPRSSALQDFADRPPWTRPGFVASAALMLLVVIAGVLIAVLAPGGDGNDVGDGRSPASPAPAESDPEQSLPTAMPTTAPAGVQWELVGPLAVPASATAGPKQITGTSASGFAHTPEGALIAAAQISTRASYSLGRDYWEPTIESQFVPGPDRDRMLAELRASDTSPADLGSQSQIAGFSYQSYTPDTAVIGLVLRAPSAGTPRYHVLSLTLLWQNGDWRMQAPPGGAWISVNRVTSDLTGVVEWGPQ
ncbi:hypothetical protein DLJ47_17950 [Micromonospora sp. S4605]|uniref:hypothetical protein n=1 Tax=Micromonospora sp. S4605 TaxID=1420897 RepID=UPI000D6F103F|nr:hypothetical protein [Micromonospora sp. S4605]PWU52736.1 hypothetical protein DLJ47_17950 [Micromonospora sp. S4605]